VDGEPHEKAVDLLKAAQGKFYSCLRCIFGLISYVFPTSTRLLYMAIWQIDIDA